MPDTPLEQFRSFDFESNTEWKAYELNVEVPANNPAALDKVKAKWYKRTIDPDFDVCLVISSMPRPEPARPPPASSTPPPTSSNSNAPGAGSGSSAPKRPGWFGFGGSSATSTTTTTTSSSSSSSSGAGPSRPPRFGGLQCVQYGAVAQAMVLVCSLLHLQPLLRPLSATGYTWALRFAAAASLVSVYQQHGVPAANLPGIKAWAPAALASAEFMAFTTQMVYMSITPIAFALVSSVVAAAYGVTAYGAQYHVTHPLWVKYGGRLRAWLLERQAAAVMLAALADISVAFMLVVLLVTPQRALLATYFTWNQLKMKYWLPNTAPPQRQAWALIDQKTLGLRLKFPILQRGVDIAARWFLAAPGR